MNKTKIEWTDYTWNPVVGCKHGCSYCYARRMAKRFHRSFDPEFFLERMSDPFRQKKSSRIFVCSTADLFGSWVPHDWIRRILTVVKEVAPWHIYIFLTKNPRRLKDFNPWPENCWVGTTVTNQADADERLPWLLQVEAPVRFVSHEPLLGEIELPRCDYCDGDGYQIIHRPGEIYNHPEPCTTCSETGFIDCPDWAILGAMTGPGAIKPKPEWVRNLWEQYRAAGVPVFMKDNLKPIMGTLVREWPAPPLPGPAGGS